MKLTIGLGGLLLAALACGSKTGQEHAAGTKGVAGMPSEGIMADIPLGDVAGPTEDTLRAQITNPYANASGTNEGEELFHRMNCVACHGYGAHGGMGPSLRDKAWRYGGTPAEIYKSIAEGRPKGMPAWGRMLPREDIWKIAAYIQSLGGATAPSAITTAEGWAAESPKGRRSDER